MRTAGPSTTRLPNLAIELRVPYGRGDVLAALHRSGEVLLESHEEDATRVRARLDQVEATRFGEFRVS